MSEISDLPKACCAREPESPENFRRRKAQEVVWNVEERVKVKEKFHLVDSLPVNMAATKRTLRDELERHTRRVLELENEITQSFAAETPVTEEPKPEVSPL